MLRRLWMVGIAATLAASGQKYDGPQPAKPDILYIKQAAMLVAMETAEARSEKAGTGTRFTVDGAASAVRTPLSLPVFLVRAQKLAPQNMQLYKMDSRDGHREYVVGGANPPDVLHLEVTKLNSEGLCRIAVSDPLEAGEYAVSSGGSNQVFCFQVF
jgi:hypothetical protein